MGLEMPGSMDECFYFTRRKFDKGRIIAWVYRPKGPSGELLQKPVNEKTGKPKVRSKIYIDPKSDYQVDVKELEPTLNVEVVYTCPHCGEEGETTTPYKWKTFKGTKAIVFKCAGCSEKIGITKKMKPPKK